MGIEFGHCMAYMVLHGVGAEEERRGDLVRGKAVSGELQHLAFSFREFSTVHLFEASQVNEMFQNVGSEVGLI